MSILRNAPVTLSILRKLMIMSHVTIFLKPMSHVTKPQKSPCRGVDFRGEGPYDGSIWSTIHNLDTVTWPFSLIHLTCDMDHYSHNRRPNDIVTYDNDKPIP